MANNVGFSSPELARAAGISLRQAKYWAATRLLVPSVADARGTGNHRRWSVRDVLTAATIAALRDRGIVSIQQLRRAAAFLAELGEGSLQDVHAKLVLAPGSRAIPNDLAIKSNDAEIVSLITAPGQRIIPAVVPVGALYAEVREHLERIRGERSERALRAGEKIESKARAGALSDGARKAAAR